MKTYFVTGSTGVIGSALIPLLLQDNNTEVELLIRADDDKQLDDRLQALINFWGYKKDEKEILNRIRTIRGDMSLLCFGMIPEEYEKLCSKCTNIIHSAGNVKMNLPIEKALNCSVDSTRNIIALARECKSNGQLKKVDFISTVGVGGKNRDLIREEWITNERLFHNTYEEAKAEAETYIYNEIKDGMPITVHRPSMVVGGSITGKIIHFQIFYHLCEFLSGRRTFGITPRITDMYLDTIPVDYAAKAIAWSSKQTSTIGKILHLCSGPNQSISIPVLKENIQKIFKSFGEKFPKPVCIPLNLFRASLPITAFFASQKTKRAIKTLPVFFDYLGEKQSFECTNTRAILEPEGIKIPDVNKYLEAILGYYLKNRAKSIVKRKG